MVVNMVVQSFLFLVTLGIKNKFPLKNKEELKLCFLFLVFYTLKR